VAALSFMTTVNAIPNGKIIFNAPAPTQPAVAATCTISNASGIFSGSFIDPLFNKKVSFQGVVNQKGNSAGGVFIRGTRAGAIRFEAPE
jgi:hypothetical protein